MLTITKEDFNEIIEKAVNELNESYIITDGIETKKKHGWRNGFRTECEPGATAAAMGLWFYISCKDEIKYMPQIAIYEILEFILDEQLEATFESGEVNKTGWIVKSLNEGSDINVASIDATATVISVLNTFCNWLDNSIDKDKQKRIKESINSGVNWLISQIQNEKQGSGKKAAWGIHEDDTNRVFVTCNVLQAILPLMAADNQKVIETIKWLLKSQNEKTGGWDATKSTPPSAGTIFHTSKTLNLLNKYLRYNNNDDTTATKDFSKKINASIKKGNEYLHKTLKDNSFCINPVIEEKCKDRNGDEKIYYHDQNNELLNLMFNTYGQWTLEEIFKVLGSFFKNYSEHEKDFYLKNDKKQMWLLLPIARQLYQVTHRYLPRFDVSITNINNCLFLDLPQATLQSEVFANGDLLNNLFNASDVTYTGKIIGIGLTDKQREAVELVEKGTVNLTGKIFDWKRLWRTVCILMFVIFCLFFVYNFYLQNTLGKILGAVAALFSILGVGFFTFKK